MGRTLTYDNGKEFAYHQKVSCALKAEGHFAHPYHSWERGLKENSNGLIPQYLPQGKSFDELTPREVQGHHRQAQQRYNRTGLIAVLFWVFESNIAFSMLP